VNIITRKMVQRQIFLIKDIQLKIFLIKMQISYFTGIKKLVE